MRLVMQLERDTDGRLAERSPAKARSPGFGSSGALEMLKILEELVPAGDGRGAER